MAYGTPKKKVGVKKKTTPNGAHKMPSGKMMPNGTMKKNMKRKPSTGGMY